MLAYGGVSAVNALGSWYGSSIAVDLKVEVKVYEDRNEIGDPLIRAILEYFRAKYGVPELRVEVRSELPPKGGLKSSSAVSTALIGEIAQKFGIDVDPPKLSAILSIKAGVSLTGALDDAVASYYGGVSLTYNKEFKVLKVLNPPDLLAVILVRGNRPRAPNIKEFRKYSKDFEEAFKLAYSGRILEAVRLNGRLVARVMGYDEALLEEAERRGALASGISGNGPSVFALVKEGDEGPLVDLFSRHGEVKVVRLVEYGSLGRTLSY